VERDESRRTESREADGGNERESDLAIDNFSMHRERVNDERTIRDFSACGESRNFARLTHAGFENIDISLCNNMER
jgi:hypothetical protein